MRDLNSLVFKIKGGIVIFMKNRFFYIFLILLGWQIQDSDDQFKFSLNKAYFGSHFMIDLESMNIVFDTTLISNFQRLGENRDWINTETSTRENVLKLYNQIIKLQLRENTIPNIFL